MVMKERLKKINKISNFKVFAICIIAIVLVMYYYEEIKEPDIKLPSQQVAVLVADVPANTVIDASMVVVERRFEDKFLKESNIAKSAEEVVGKRTKVPLFKGELINNDRLLVNQGYMDESIDKRQISFQINDIDQALNLKKGDFVDVWVIRNNIESLEITRKLFEKLQVVEVVNTNKVIIGNDEKDKEETIATYVVLQLDDKGIEELFSIDKNFNDVKISRYKENEQFALVAEKVEVQAEKKEGETNEQGAN
ncbi:MAG: SAF domain-containing protein [Sedimentibacter sp.]